MNAFDIRNIKKGNVTCIFKTSSTQNNLLGKGNREEAICKSPTRGKFARLYVRDSHLQMYR